MHTDDSILSEYTSVLVSSRIFEPNEGNDAGFSKLMARLATTGKIELLGQQAGVKLRLDGGR